MWTTRLVLILSLAPVADASLVSTQVRRGHHHGLFRASRRAVDHARFGRIWRMGKHLPERVSSGVVFSLRTLLFPPPPLFFKVAIVKISLLGYSLECLLCYTSNMDTKNTNKFGEKKPMKKRSWVQGSLFFFLSCFSFFLFSFISSSLSIFWEKGLNTRNVIFIHFPGPTQGGFIPPQISLLLKLLIPHF